MPLSRQHEHSDATVQMQEDEELARRLQLEEDEVGWCKLTLD